jgi:hypothetical protein
MPIWMRSDDPADHFRGALYALRDLDRTVQDADWLGPESVRRYSQPADVQLAEWLRQEHAELHHTLDNAIDALDACIRSGHRRRESENLLAAAIPYRQAIEAAEVGAFRAATSQVRQALARIGGSDEEVP